jgi:hypothetical protein
MTHDIASGTETRDWQRNREMWVRVLERQTGENVDAWNRRIGTARLRDVSSLRAWLARQGVTGYGQSLLVMERFGYPDFVLATADELISTSGFALMTFGPVDGCSPRRFTRLCASK